MQDHDLITGIIPSEEKTIFFALKESEHLFVLQLMKFIL